MRLHVTASNDSAESRIEDILRSEAEKMSDIALMLLSGSAASGRMWPDREVDHALSKLTDILKEPAGKIVRDASI